jgi:hypothetical protein
VDSTAQSQLFVTDKETDSRLYQEQLDTLLRREFIDLPLYELRLGAAIAEGMAIARKASEDRP